MNGSHVSGEPNKKAVSKAKGTQSDVAEESDVKKLREENQRLQSKADKNEKTIQQLKFEQTEHLQILKAKDAAKKRNNELMSEHDAMLAENKRLIKKAQEVFGAKIEVVQRKYDQLEKDMQQLKNDCIELEENTRKTEDDDAVGEVYFKRDKGVLENMVAQQKQQLQTVTQKLHERKKTGSSAVQFTNVNDFMAKRAMLIDLVVSRREALQKSDEENAKLEQTVQHLEKTVESLQRMWDQVEKNKPR